MNNLFFYFPVLYRYHTREKGYFFLPFIITDFLPPLFICFDLFNGLSVEKLLIYLFSYLGMFIIYEIGYIINDGMAVKYEKNPSVRLTKNESLYFDRFYLNIFGIRFFLFCFFSCVILFFKTDITIYLLANILLLIFYLYHNFFRNQIRYFTNFFLNIGKYFIPVILLLSEINLSKLFILFLMFPLLRSITYVVERKFLKINMDYFQVLYTSVVFFILLGANFILNHNFSVSLVLFIGLFFLYRCLVFFFRSRR